jgi:hypothetical protein
MMLSLVRRLAKLEAETIFHFPCAAICLVRAGEDAEAKQAAVLAEYQAEYIRVQSSCGLAAPHN